MFIVKTKLDRSPINGVGVFADEDIPKGTTVWRFHPGLDGNIHKEKIADLEPAARIELERLGYTEPGNPNYLFLCRGHAAFVNHSYEPNLVQDGDVEVAARDIGSGEEMTSDYRQFESEFDPAIDCAGELPAVNG